MTQPGSTIPRILFGIVFSIYVFSLHSQDFVNTKTKSDYPPAPLKRAYDLYDIDKNYGSALELVDEYLISADTSLDMRTYIAALELKFHLYRRQEGVGYEGAFPVILEAITLAKKHLATDDILFARVYKTYGSYYHRNDDFYTSRSIMDTVVNLYNSATEYDSTLLATIWNYKYYSYLYSFGSEDTLIKYVDLRFKLEQAKEDPDPDEILYILQDFPEIYINKGDYDKALTSAIQGYKYAKENRNALLMESDDFLYRFKTYADTYQRLIESLYYKTYYSEAIKIGEDLFQLMADYKVSPENYVEYYSVQRNIGQIYINQGKYEQALVAFNEALKIGMEERERAIFYSRILSSKAECLLTMGKESEALETYANSLDIIKRYIAVPSSTLHDPYNEFGDYYDQIEDYKSALIYYDSALFNSLPSNKNLWYEFPEDSTQALTLEQIKTIGRKMINLSKVKNDSISINTLLESTLIYAQNLSDILISRRNEFQASEGKLFLSNEFKFIYETAIQACYHLFENSADQKYVRKALSFSRLSKSILFLEQVSEYEKVYNNVITDELKFEFGNYIKHLNQLESGFISLLDEGITSDSIVIINDQIEQIRTNQDSLNQIIDQDLALAGVESYSSSYLNDIDNLNLRDDEVLIEYFYGEEDLFVISYHQGKGVIFREELTDKFSDDLLYVLNEIRNPPLIDNFEERRSNYLNRSYSLYEKLLKPVLSELTEPKALIIVPDNLLSRLPFEVLITKKDAATGFNSMDYLLKEHQIRYDLSSLRLNNEEPVISKDDILALGFSGSNSSSKVYAALPGTEKEINTLKASYNGVFINSASKSDFMNNARNYEILHIAVHGLADTVTTYDSKLIFSGGNGDNELKTSDLYLASLNSKLAVLSACETGLGVIRKGEGAFSIARGFALAGVPSLVMTLWSVNDKISSNLMEDMYALFLDEGEDINSALRNTKIQYLNQSDDYFAHPYYWASFVHLGENLNSGKSKTSNVYLFVLLGIILSLVLVISGYKKRKKV